MKISEIAEALGVSKTTVSRALSGKGRIGAETRKRVQDYVREQGEREKSSTLYEKLRTQSIAVVIPRDVFSNNMPFFHECLLGISDAATMLRYDVLVIGSAAHDLAGVQALVEKQKVDGFLFLRGIDGDRTIKYLVDIGFPVGLVGECDYKEVIQVDIEHREAAERLTSYTINAGYRRYAVIMGNTDFRVNRNRLQGVLSALEKRGISESHRLYFPNILNMELVNGIIPEIIDKKVECIICGDDEICTKVVSTLQAEGYRIPRDVAVASLHNSMNLDCFSPSITTVNVSPRKMGHEVARQMIHCLQGEKYDSSVKLEYEVLLRKSTENK